MPVNPRKRQKELERRKAKQKAERRNLARRESRSLALRMQDLSAAPVLHSFMMPDVWLSGIGTVLLSRQSANGQVAFASFLVDVYCLGADGYHSLGPNGSLPM